MPGARELDASSRPRLAGEGVAHLVAEAAHGDQSAWNALVDEFGGMVWATTRVHRLGDGDAADVVQSTWLRLAEQLHRIEDPPRVGAWLATAARRECLAVIGRVGRLIAHADDLPDLPSDAPQPSDRVIDRQDAVRVRDALERLGPRDRALLRMLTVDPTPSYEEISAALGMARGSIGPARARVLARLGEW